MNMLEVKNLTFKYDNHNFILDNLSFNIKHNELISIVGGSGCRKSTIIKIFAGIEKNFNGIVQLKSISYYAIIKYSFTMENYFRKYTFTI